MPLKILMLINLLAYSIIVGQAYMYIIALANVQKRMDAPSYIRLRHLLDMNFMAKYKWAVYISLITSTLLCFFTAFDPTGILFISSVIAFIALIIDTLLTIKGNLPINKMINSWTAEDYPDNWQAYRGKWLFIYTKRQAAAIIGFISLLIGALFNN